METGLVVSIFKGEKMTKRSIVKMLMATSAIVAVSPALAQTSPRVEGATTASAPAPEAQPAPSDILVTARRRTENIIDVPLAISVVSGAQIDKLNITNTNQLANFVPGLEFNDFTPGNSRNDRGGNRLLIFRGLNLAGNGGVTGAGSMFLDGAAVIGNEIPAGMDIGAVEVLRGPQNVYFGRASMTGAVSYRTKAIPDHIEGAVEATIAERSTHRVEASVAGPLVPGLIGFRISGLDESNGGYIRNDFNNGAEPKLGARSRKSISGTLEITPANGLEIKLYSNYFKDVDGVSATANIFPDSANGTGAVTNCLVGSSVVVNGATLAPLGAICGEVPGREYATNYENTVIPARDAAYVYNIPFLKGEGFKKQPGLQRNALNSHAVINYRVSDYLKLQSITGYHTDAVVQIGDGVQQPIQPGATYSNYDYNLANKFSDFSQELRLSSDPDRAFSWTVGSNYVNARNQSTAVVTFTSNPATGTPTFTPLPQNITDDRAKTYGFFAGGYLKLLDKRLTLSAEGRYQIDDRRTIILTNPAEVPITDISKPFKSFNPRVSADFDVGGRRRVYASFATGSRPGGFNSGLYSYLNASPAVAAGIASTFGPVDLEYKEEKLRVGELGFKGNFAGGKGYFDINAYYGVLDNQQVRRSLLIPALGFSLGATQNTGKTEIYGIEWSGSYNFTRQFSVSTTFAWNHTNRLSYIDNSPTTVRIFGTSDFSGKQLPNAPQFTGSAVLTYDAGTDTDRWMPFANTALVYRGKQWADIGNLAYIKGRATVDVRGGIANRTFRAELFVTNLFNNKTYPGGNVAPDFGGNAVNGIPVSYSGFFGAYAEPRTVGARFTAKF